MTKQEILKEMNRLQNEMREIEKQEKIELGKESWKSRETMKLFKRVLDTTINMFFDSEGLSEIKNMSIAGMKVSFIPEKLSDVKRSSGLATENKQDLKEVIGKESLISKVKRLSALNPAIHVTNSDLSYPKPARAWLEKNFGTVEI